VARLGLVDYEAAWGLQKRLAAARAAGKVDDLLLLLEHPHTYTLGRSAQAKHLLLDASAQSERGVKVVWVDRGGDITYHGPGQLVGYPILHLGQTQDDGRLPKADYVGYIRHIEAMLIRALAAFGIRGEAEAGFTGVWVDGTRAPGKIGAIGVRVNGAGVSTHGFALNVNTDLSYFGGIVPCGIPDRPVTSLAAILGRRVDMGEALEAVERAFAAEFSRELRTANGAALKLKLLTDGTHA
jgi:lipoate-protein ligase B